MNDMSIDFVSLDIEDADKVGTICSIALVRVREGCIVGQADWLIDPEHGFSPRAIKEHGITSDQVKGKPTFGQKWDDIRLFIGNDILIAFHAVDDMLRLIYDLQAYKMTYQCRFACAERLSQEILGYDRMKGAKNDLAAYCQKCGIKHSRKKPHKAIKDAHACALLTIKLCEIKQANSICELCDGIVDIQLLNELMREKHIERL